MTYEEAKRILHPDTTLEALAEIEYYGGFNGPEAQIKAVNAACLVACEAIDKALAMQWVPVSERLPELIPCSAGTAYSEAVITLTSERRVVEAIYDGKEFIGPYDFWECEDDERVTHWAPIPMPLPPLPEPPKEEQ